MNKKIRKKILMLINAGIISLGIFMSDINTNKVYSMENYENLEGQQTKVAYITIDDGPSKYTNTIIDILEKYNVKATFFMIDRNMHNYPQQVKTIINEGHAAGFHSVSHDVHKLYENSDSAKSEFDKNKETFYEITNKKSNLIRLPYGSKPYTPIKSYEKLVEAGYKLWDWDLDTQDWKSNSQQIVQNVKKYTEGKNEVIILIHEKKQTVEALEEIIIYLIKEGYEILPINENQTPKNFWCDEIQK